MAQLGARLDGIEEVVGSNPIGSTKIAFLISYHNRPSEARGRATAGKFKVMKSRLACGN